MNAPTLAALARGAPTASSLLLVAAVGCSGSSGRATSHDAGDRDVFFADSGWTDARRVDSAAGDARTVDAARQEARPVDSATRDARPVDSSQGDARLPGFPTSVGWGRMGRGPGLPTPGEPYGSWTQLPGGQCGQTIGAGAGALYVTGCQDPAGNSPISVWDGSSWTETAMVAYSVHGGGFLYNQEHGTSVTFLAGRQGDDTLYYEGLYAWQQIPGVATGVDVDPWGAMWITGCPDATSMSDCQATSSGDYGIYFMTDLSNPADPGWTAWGGAGIHPAVGGAACPWVITAGGAVMNYCDPSNPVQVSGPGTADTITADFLGDVWIVGPYSVSSASPDPRGQNGTVLYYSSLSGLFMATPWAGYQVGFWPTSPTTVTPLLLTDWSFAPNVWSLSGGVYRL